MSENKRVVITGIGPICSLGIGKKSLWDNLLSAQTRIVQREEIVDGQLWGKFHVHAVDRFSVNDFGIDSSLLAWIKDWKDGDESIDLQYLIAAVKLALDDSKLPYNPYGKNSFGIIVSHENPNLMAFLAKVSGYAYKLFTEGGGGLSQKDFYDKLYWKGLKSGYDAQAFMLLFHLAKIFGIHEFSSFTCNACASGLYALEIGSAAIKNNQADVMIVAASDYADIYKYLWFQSLGIYSPDGVIRSFSKNSNGLVFGDGGVALVLEDLEHAKQRNVPIYAEYLGGGFSLESWQVATPQIGSDSYQNAIRKALDQSSITVDEIDLLCPHGVGSKVIDYYESKAITDIFGVNSSKPFMTALKPYIGHNLGGSVLLETAILLLSLQRNLVLPTLNYVEQNSLLRLVPEQKKAVLKIAMKICCAFAGYNAAAIFKRVEDCR